jgi:hypothetical protein
LTSTPADASHNGAGLVETLVVLPTLLLVVTCIWQAALVYRAKAAVNYAALEAARAGSVDNARSSAIEGAFRRALIPYYGGGRTYCELGDTMQCMLRDIDDPDRSELLARVEILLLPISAVRPGRSTIPPAPIEAMTRIAPQTDLARARWLGPVRNTTPMQSCH